MALTDNLVSYWKLDETSGTRADSTGTNDLADFNTVLSGTGIISNGADFEQANSEYLQKATATLALTGDFSFSWWMKTETNPPNDTQWMIFWNNDGGNNGFYIANAQISSVAGCRLVFYNGGSAPMVALWTQTFTTGTWYHCVITYNATTNTGQFWVNGTKNGTDKSSSGDMGSNTGSKLTIGGTASSGDFDGIIDEAGIWSRKLSDAEIASLYNSGSGLTYPFSASSAIKTINGLALASVKTVNGLSISSVKTVNGLA